jgi:hypothetical protein
MYVHGPQRQYFSGPHGSDGERKLLARPYVILHARSSVDRASITSSEGRIAMDRLTRLARTRSTYIVLLIAAVAFFFIGNLGGKGGSRGGRRGCLWPGTRHPGRSHHQPRTGHRLPPLPHRPPRLPTRRLRRHLGLRLPHRDPHRPRTRRTPRTAGMARPRRSRPVRPRSLRPSPGKHSAGRSHRHPQQRLTTAGHTPTPARSTHRWARSRSAVGELTAGRAELRTLRMRFAPVNLEILSSGELGRFNISD